MDNSFIRKMLIVVILFIIIITISLLIIFNVFLKTQDNFKKTFEEGDAGDEVNFERHEVEQPELYYAVRDYINNFLSSENNTNIKNNKTIIDNKEVLKNEYVYSMLSKAYIVDNQISLDNVLSKVETYDEHVIFIPLEMQEEIGNITSTFYVHGIITNDDNELLKETYFIVILDCNNKTYSIYPLDYKYSSLNQIKYSNTNVAIEVNNYNKYDSYPNVNYDYLTKEYFEWYKKLCLIKPEIIYNSLLNDYKNIKFPSLNSFENYIQKNRNKIDNAKIVSYKSNFYGDYIEFKIQDNNNNIYIIRDYGKHNITIQLDDYSLENEIVNEEYEQLSEKEKGIANINRFIQMLRFNDYESAYNVLDEDFRIAKFGTIQEFKNYIENNIDLDKDMILTNYQEHIKHMHFYKMMYKDSDNNKTFISFIIQLLNDNKFKMSFDVE